MIRIYECKNGAERISDPWTGRVAIDMRKIAAVSDLFGLAPDHTEVVLDGRIFLIHAEFDRFVREWMTLSG